MSLKQSSIKKHFPYIILALLFGISAGPFSSWAVECEKIFSHLQQDKLDPADEAKVEENILSNFDDLTSVRPPSKEVAQKWNEKVVTALENLPMPLAEKGELPSFTQAQIEEMHHRMTSDAMLMSTLHAPNKYDPDVHNQIGYCFGRAWVGHVLAHLKMHLNNESIRKVWVVGPMSEDGIVWHHHVAIAVRRDDGKWFVLDQFYVNPMSVSDWLHEFSVDSDDGKLMLFATKPDRFAPESTDPIFESTVQNGYNGFFRDNIHEFGRDGESIAEQIKDLSK